VRTVRTAVTAIATLVTIDLAFAAAVPARDLVGDCRVGIYRLSEGTDVDVAPDDGDHLSWRKEEAPRRC